MMTTPYEEARENAQQYLIADFEYMMGRGEKPDPADFGYSGGNIFTAQCIGYHIDDLCTPTMPVHAGF